MVTLSKEASEYILQRLRENPEVKYGEKPVGTVEKVNDDGTITIKVTDPEIVAVLLDTLLPSVSYQS